MVQDSDKIIAIMLAERIQSFRLQMVDSIIAMIEDGEITKDITVMTVAELLEMLRK
jgi:hypothetical protein